MARTRASVAAKVVTGKSSKARSCAPQPPSSNSSSGSSGDKSSRSYTGGNSVCPRETPAWQKPITNFFIQNAAAKADDEEVSAKAGHSKSKSKPKRNIIHSDDEEDTDKQADGQTDKPINKELDETIELEPLTGEASHKINEYYSTKDKGTGKKTSTIDKDIDKENKDGNVTRNKRHLDELNEEDERNGKRIKLD